MLYAMDAIVNEAAKWRHDGEVRHLCLYRRAIVNRGGEQGAQHSQSITLLVRTCPRPKSRNAVQCL